MVAEGDHGIWGAGVPGGGAGVGGSGGGGAEEFLREENQAVDGAGGRSIYEESVVYVGRGDIVAHGGCVAGAFAGRDAEKVGEARGVRGCAESRCVAGGRRGQSRGESGGGGGVVGAGMGTESGEWRVASDEIGQGESG